MLDLALIRIDGGTQSRVELNQQTVAEYAEAYRNGAEFPPVTVFYDGANWWLADGFHRYAGAQKAGKTQILEHIIPGTQRDAILYSFKANATHGLKRTNADKHKAVEAMLSDAEWGQWSDNQIAKACGVSQPFVSGIRSASYNGYKIDGTSPSSILENSKIRSAPSSATARLTGRTPPTSARPPSSPNHRRRPTQPQLPPHYKPITPSQKNLFLKIVDLLKRK
jgi:hypothetical protein